MNDFDDYQKKQSDVYPHTKSLEYLVLRLANKVGCIAEEAALITRGDYESKGVHAYEDAVDDIMVDCSDILRYVALITTVLEKKLSDVLETRKQHTL
jgi:hypothetical protein